MEEGDGGWAPPAEAESSEEAESSLERDGKIGEGKMAIWGLPYSFILEKHWSPKSLVFI